MCLPTGSPSCRSTRKGGEDESYRVDVHLDFCEVAICESGSVRSAGRVETTPERLELFAQSLAADDRVALEVTANSWEIARILEAHVARVIVVSPGDTGMRQARAKTDRLDARTLAKLLAAGELDAVWVPDPATWVMRRRLSRRGQLVHARTRVKNEIHAVLMRQLIGRPPVSDLFGAKGRAWLAELELALEERETVASGIRQVEFLDQEIAQVEQLIAQVALQSPEIKRLMTVPGSTRSSPRASWPRSAMCTASRTPASWSATWALTPGSRSQVALRRRTGGSQSRVRRVHATPSWRRAGARCDSPGRSRPSTSASVRAAATTSRSSPARASSPASSGIYSPAKRTTPTPSPRSPRKNSDALKSPPAQSATPRAVPVLGRQRCGPPGRAGARPPSRARLRAHRA